MYGRRLTMIKKTFVVVDKTGIHARPAMLLVSKANIFKSEIYISYKEKQANLKSIISLMSLGVPKGAEIIITVTGIDEEETFSQIEREITEMKLCELIS